MGIEFVQKRWSSSRKFILTPDKIVVETKTIRKNMRYEVRLDRLGLDLHYQSDNTIAGKIFFGFCISIIIAVTIITFWGHAMSYQTLTLNYIIWAILAFFAYFKQHEDDIYLVGGETNLAFYRNIPNEQAVLEFIDKVKDRIKIYLKEKYTAFYTTTSGQEFYMRINWLKEREIIDEIEYIEIKSTFDNYRLLG